MLHWREVITDGFMSTMVWEKEMCPSQNAKMDFIRLVRTDGGADQSNGHQHKIFRKASKASYGISSGVIVLAQSAFA
jgi:hypothetical protein